MSETYPVLLCGEKKGTLTVSREGLTTRFDAKCEDPGTLVRLSVYGALRRAASPQTNPSTEWGSFDYKKLIS